MLKQRSQSLYRKQEENSDDREHLQHLAQSQHQQLTMMQKEISAAKQREFENQSRIRELLQSNREWEEALQ